MHDETFNPAGEVPINLLPGDGTASEPEICTCTDCRSGGMLNGSSLDGYTTSYTPADHGVELATGKLRWSFPITRFDTRLLGFNMQLHHTSLFRYNGPWGQSFSHSFNMMIVQTGPLSGQIVTPDLRICEISSDEGEIWRLPRGFFSRLTLDAAQRRWRMIHVSGLEVVFFQGATHRPGYPILIRDPNGNSMRLEYDASGLLQRIMTDLNQVQSFAYDANHRLRTFTDHIGRSWHFTYDEHNRLTRMIAPVTEYADISAGQEIKEKDLNSVLVKQPRTITLGYADQRFTSHITSVTDQRGAIPNAREYDEQGRVRHTLINGKPVRYDYAPDFPLKRLEESNLVTRVTDREGNVCDYEIHGPEGGPVKGRGRFGLRRKITWTERGKGNAPLRDDEPRYWEERWLHDCKCLAPKIAVQPFSSEDAEKLVFDDVRIPTSWPRTIYEYNQYRQVTTELYTDGFESIRTEMAYQEAAFGENGQYSRMIHWIDPRQFDDTGLYEGLTFTHTYTYDERGNRVRHDFPTVTRGVDTPQIITESWEYNAFGQVIRHTDPNGNLTVKTYYEGPSTGGDINTKGEFGGYLASVIRGADGSRDAVTNLKTIYKVNALGMKTAERDPSDFVYDTEYNDLQEITRSIEPLVTLRNGKQVRYETRHVYDGAGNEVMTRRSNIDVNGSLAENAWIDRSRSYDVVNNLLSERVEVDANDAHDLVTRHAYDGNDDLIVTCKPEGNREFWIYDERKLSYKTFYGVAPGSTTNEGYPTIKRVEDLGRTAFIGMITEYYDARRNPVRRRDGRGNYIYRFYDFNNRQIAQSDANVNGWVCAYDKAANILTTERGGVSTNGRLTELLERVYARFDETGRRYQIVLDIDLGGDERNDVNPAIGQNASCNTIFDPGSRIVERIDANGNVTACLYDAANRQTTIRDALNNTRHLSYDANSNVIRAIENEVAGPGASGDPENYVTTLVYDELNRQSEAHVGGLNGSLDHRMLAAYDSRHNVRLIQDAEGNCVLTTFDDADRVIAIQRFDRDPFTGSPTELFHQEREYDRNGRKISDRAFRDINEPDSVQITRYLYDSMDRTTFIFYPDSEDSIDGSTRRPDSVFDRVEFRYDANSNTVQATDQRGVTFQNSFDAGNRLTEQTIVLPPGVPGVTRQTFAFDALNRIINARNDYAEVSLDYDSFSRLVAETQSIRLDGSGFSNGWEHPIQLIRGYDRQSNRTTYKVLDGANANLNIVARYDLLNRVDSISAEYFNVGNHVIADYAYFGTERVQTKILGNGARLTSRFDVKRRIASYQWTGPSGPLVGFTYDYDRMDNALFERFTHDKDQYDHFQYNSDYEVTGVSYRVPRATPPRDPNSVFSYDDLFNRIQASYSDPLGARRRTLDRYTVNEANENVRLLRNRRSFLPGHDPAGNQTLLWLQPAVDTARPRDVSARARWDAFNCLFDIKTERIPQQHYRYDPFLRRIASLELSGDRINGGSRRYLYDGWRVVEERLFNADTELAVAPSTLERVYVYGRQFDEPLLAAIDRNSDGVLSGSNAKNVREEGADQEYYFLGNRIGSVMALLDADNAGQVLEYYRYTIFGEAFSLPAVGNGTGLDTSRGAKGPSRAFGNFYLFTGQRLDLPTGLYYYRNRYYDPRSGRFISRDPVGYPSHRPDLASHPNLYAYVNNNPTNHIDPLGLWSPNFIRWVLVYPLEGGPIYFYYREFIWGFFRLTWAYFPAGTITITASGELVISWGVLCAPIEASLGAVIIIALAATAAGIGLGYGIGTGIEYALTPEEVVPLGNPPATPGNPKSACTSVSTPIPRQVENNSWGCVRSLRHAQQKAEAKCTTDHQCQGSCGPARPCRGTAVVDNVLQEPGVVRCTTYLYYHCDCGC